MCSFQYTVLNRVTVVSAYPPGFLQLSTTQAAKIEGVTHWYGWVTAARLCARLCAQILM